MQVRQLQGQAIRAHGEIHGGKAVQYLQIGVRANFLGRLYIYGIHVEARAGEVRNGRAARGAPSEAFSVVVAGSVAAQEQSGGAYRGASRTGNGEIFRRMRKEARRRTGAGGTARGNGIGKRGQTSKPANVADDQSERRAENAPPQTQKTGKAPARCEDPRADAAQNTRKTGKEKAK